MKQATIDRLKELEKKATPGPWMFEKGEHRDEGTIHYVLRTVEKLAEHPWSPRFIAFFTGCLGEIIPRRKPSDYRDDPQTEVDAELICEMRNHLHELLEAKECELRRLECIHCGNAIYDNGTVYVHKVPTTMNGKIMICETQWCPGQTQHIAETEATFAIRESRTPAPWGTTIASMMGEFPETKPRDHYGIAAFEVMLGPMGAVASAFNSNFNQHGWRLR